MQSESGTSKNVFSTVRDVGDFFSNLINGMEKSDEVDSTDALPGRSKDFHRSFMTYSPQSVRLPATHFPTIHPTLTQRDSEAYNLHSGERLVLVFNHSKFEGSRDIPPRVGTDKDVEAIRDTFESMSFVVQECENFTVSQIEDKLCQLQDMHNLSCLIIFISTHGEDDGILYGYDVNYRLDRDVIQSLLPECCPALAGKPKLVFIQACQGDIADEGAYLIAGTRKQEFDGRGSASAVYRIPSYSDILVYQATYKGYYSFRSNSGSWFIQSICKELKNSSEEEDLISVLTRVSRYVALEKTSNVPDNLELHDKKQVPLRQDTLLRKVYLKSFSLNATEDKPIKPLGKFKAHSEPFLKKKDRCRLM